MKITFITCSYDSNIIEVWDHKRKEVKTVKKWYKKEELLKKFAGKFIDTYPLHYEYWNEKTNKYETVYEVRGTSKTIKENYNLPENCIIK